MTCLTKLVYLIMAIAATVTFAAPVATATTQALQDHPLDVAAPAVSNSAALASGASTLANSHATSSNRQDYIIIFEKGLSTPDRIVQNFAQKLRDYGVTINYQYHTIIQGFSVTLDPAIISTLEKFQDSDYPFIIEEDKDARAYN